MTEKELKNEFKKLKSNYLNLDSTKLNTLTPLIERAAFLKCSLNDMEQDLKSKGFMEYSNQGNSRERPVFKSYKDTLLTYSNVVRNIDAIAQTKNDDALEDSNERTLIIDDIV